MGQTVTIMTKLFFSYGGRANNGSLYYPLQGNRSFRNASYCNHQHKEILRTEKLDSPDDRSVVNEVTKKKIQALFTDGLGTYPNGDSRSYVGVRTTGCGAWEIGFTYALADTLRSMSVSVTN